MDHQSPIVHRPSPISRVVPDPDLVEWVVNSTEWPQALVGSFEERFLKLPREILITVMRGHQHYFAVEDRDAHLEARFITVLNRDLSAPLPGKASNPELRTPNPADVIRHGHERVLTARFTDAEFFWNADQKIPLRDRLPMLERVTYQAKLGSYGDKVRRMEAIANGLCSLLVAQKRLTEADAEHVARAVRLCKCDLTTQMVQEFTELQGVVGGLYARAQGEPQGVWQAIYDHYLPANIEDRCPRGIVGAVVSLVDKIDTVVAGFAAGLEPTGSSDPFGLRRAGNGIIKTLIETEISLPLRQIVDQPLVLVQARMGSSDFNTYAALLRFLEERLRHYLETSESLGLRFDTVRAVLSAGWNDPLDALARARALEDVRLTDNFQALAAAAKRIRNILVKSATDGDWHQGETDERLIEGGPEAELLTAYVGVLTRASLYSYGGPINYRQAFESIASLRPVVDHFFDQVLVMVENRAVRQNRLRLLKKLDELFSRFADLSQIESSTSNVGAPTSKAGTGDE